MRLAELSQINSPSGRGVNLAADILKNSQFLQFMEESSGYDLDSTNFTYNVVEAGSSLKDRAINASFSTTALTPGQPLAGTQAIMGDEVKFDTTYKRDAERGLGNAALFFEREFNRRKVNYAGEIEQKLFAGSGASGQFRGLRTILNGTDNVPGTSTTCVINAKNYAPSGATSFDMTSATAANAARFKEMLNDIRYMVPGLQGIVVNRTLAGRITTFGDVLKLGTSTTNGFGTQIKEIDGLKIIVVTNAAIPNNEPDDAGTPANVTTSIYPIVPGPGRCALKTNSGITYWDYDQPDNTQSETEWWEMAGSWAIETADSVLRIRNLKIV